MPRLEFKSWDTGCLVRGDVDLPFHILKAFDIPVFVPINVKRDEWESNQGDLVLAERY